MPAARVWRLGRLSCRTASSQSGRRSPVEDGCPVLPLPVEKVFRRVSTGEPQDRVLTHSELPGHGPLAVPGGQQCVNGGVLGTGALGEPVAGRPGRTGRLAFGRGLRPKAGGLRHEGSEAAAVLGDGSFGGFAQVVPEVPPVRDLDRLRRSGGGALGEERRSVPADDLDAGPLGEPCGQT